MPHTSQPTTQAQRVQVLERWNQWVRVRFEHSGAETWVDLAETGYAPTDAPDGPMGKSSGPDGASGVPSAEKKNKNVPPSTSRPSDSGA